MILWMRPASERWRYSVMVSFLSLEPWFMFQIYDYYIVCSIVSKLTMLQLYPDLL